MLLQNSVMLLGLFLCQVDSAFTIYCMIIITNHKSKKARAKRLNAAVKTLAQESGRI